MDGHNFYHTTVLLNEAVAGLAIKKDGIYVDATFGGGGHSRAILSQLGAEGRLLAFDQDADAWKNKPDDNRVIPITENFKYLKKFLRLHGYTAVDGILADLGVSSWQFDTGERGFSTRYEGPLDMRMDQRGEKTAEMVLRTYSESELHQVFEQYGEVRNSKQLAKQIVNHRGRGALKTIEGFKAIINPVVKGSVPRYLAQVFQALRIEVNDELGALKELLTQVTDCMKPGGRLCVITFHSLEDRIVKRFIKKGGWEDDVIGMYGQERKESDWKEIVKKPIEPTAEELKKNPRARSARLRIAEKK